MLPSIGIAELMVLGVVAVLLFGRRLPEVARNVGRGYGELRKGLTELQSTISSEVDTEAAVKGKTSFGKNSQTVDDFDDYDEPTAPRLEPPTEKETSESKDVSNNKTETK